MFEQLAAASGTEAADERDRWTWLALARFVLAVVVVVFHIQRRLGLWENTWVTELDGRVSVIAFLVISGFSIASSLDKSAKGFYRRRLLRIYPLLIGTVVFTQILSAVAPERYAVRGWGNALGNVVFPPGLVWAVPTLNLPLWSLGVEMLFYAAAPFLFRAHAGVRWGLVVLSMAAYWSRLVLEWSWGLPALCFLWAWMLGFELYRWRTRGVLFVTFFSAALLRFNPTVTYAPYAVLLYAGTLLILVAPRLPPVRGRVARAIDYLGAISFPLYLVHFPVVVTAVDSYRVSCPGLISLAVLAATLFFHHAVDGPGRKLLGRLV